MGRVYLDTVDGLTEVKEMIADGGNGIIELIELTENKTKVSLENKINTKQIKEFNKIFKSFNSDKPLNNPKIREQLKGKNGEVYSNFIDFCNYLIHKINGNITHNELKKIPLIIANLSDYKGKTGGKRITDNIVKEKRNSVMTIYRKKIGDKKNHLCKSFKSNPNKYV